MLRASCHSQVEDTQKQGLSYLYCSFCGAKYERVESIHGSVLLGDTGNSSCLLTREVISSLRAATERLGGRHGRRSRAAADQGSSSFFS